MVRLHSFILILPFLEFWTDSVLAASQSSEEISAIIQSYTDAFTTIAPVQTQRVTTQIYPSIEVQDREYVHDLTKVKNGNKPALSSVPLADVADSSFQSKSSEEYLSTAVGASNESKESEGSADRAISFLRHENSQVFKTVLPEESQRVTTQLYPTIEPQNHGYKQDFIRAKYANNSALTNVPLHADTSNQYTVLKDSSASEESDDSYESGEPAHHHVIPFSEHENPKEPPTRPNYTAPGVWARPSPDKNIALDFVPTKLLAQVRNSHTIKHVPREYAMASAETSEERENAARLKEVLKESKANTVYTEEGYEDAAYDHAGHIRDADFQEDFARKLKEESDVNKSYSGGIKHPKTYKNHKPHKHRDHNHGNFFQANKNPSKTAKRAKKSKQKINRKHYRLLRNVLNQPVINPKLAIEKGIIGLEKDLKHEYREAQLTSTESYIHTTTVTPTTLKSPATESAFQSKMDFETTTTRRNVFTIRPRKTVVTITPKSHRNKPKKPLKVFSVSPNIDHYNTYTTSTYNYEPTQLFSTIDYGKLVLGYLPQNQNSTPTMTYPSSHFEQQSVNPLAVATVNGHGPYLVVVTAAPETLTSSPSGSQNLVSSVKYSAVNDDNITQPILNNIRHKEFMPINVKTNRGNYNSELHAIPANTDVSGPVFYNKSENRHHGKNPKSTKFKSQSFPEGKTNYNEGHKDSYMKYYTELQSSKTSNIPNINPNYKANANRFNQWPNLFDSTKPVEGYGWDSIERPPSELKKIRGASLVTRLLAPAPLSTSEYATFQRQSREVKPMTPAVMEIMPIIDAIHKHEYEQNLFPFRFRRKRSTFGFFRSPNFKPKGQKDEGNDENKNLSQNSSNSSSIKYPINFQSLLDESTHVATKDVDAEIKKHFESDTKAISKKALSQSSEEFTSNKNTSSNSKEDFKRDETVEVEIPELDFTSIFERDEIQPTTKELRIDSKKYPFYRDSSTLRNSALKYIVNPKEVPKKTLGGMEFYNSRVLECEEINPDLEKIIPGDEEIANKRGLQKKKSRLHGLGDKIDCYKAKYFDEIPFDNPLFSEKDVEMPHPPIELNPKKFAARILELPADNEEYTILKGPKNPEFLNLNRGSKIRRPSRYHVSTVNVRQHLHPKFRKSNLLNANTPRYRYLSKSPISIDDGMRPPDPRSKMKIKSTNLKIVPRYQRLVYEDVMGNIMNLDKSQKSHVPKRGVAPLYSKYYKIDNNREHGLGGSKKLKTVKIDGLVPPPQKIADKLVNNKHRYKRNTPLKDYQELLSEKKNTTDKATFRIVFTTSAPRSIFSEKKRHDSDKINTTIAQKTNHAVNHSLKYSKNSKADSGHYGKFSTTEKINSSTATRKKEPKYNLAEKVSSPNRTSIIYKDSTFANSTLIPVMVNLNENFTSRTPRGSKNNQAKKQVTEEFDHGRYSDKLGESDDDNLDPSNEQEEDPKKQFIVFNPDQGPDKNKSNDVAITKYSSTPSTENHEELVEFLKGNPPGYDEAFAEEDDDTDDEREELPYKVKGKDSDVNGLLRNNESHKEHSDTQESPNNEEKDDDITESETEENESNKPKKEIYGEETATDDSPREVEENMQSDDEEKSSNDDVQEDKPFVRFSSRPESPSENFEDEKYSDLGPRVNKPYFYHPPFDIPTYEKYALGKSIQDHNGDDYGHEETEYHEKYVFPWAHDDEKEDNKEEAEHYSAFYHHEYPWEKRERRERERHKRDKIHKKQGKKNVNPNYDSDSYEKASNVELVYGPTINKYLRGKKDVNSLQSDPENHSSKFSSKYKSEKTEDPKGIEKNEDDIHKSISKYVKNIDISTPNTDALVINTNTQTPFTTLNSSKVENVGRIISTTISPFNRSRGRIRRVNRNKNKHNDTVVSDENHISKVKTTLSSKITRQRGRNRNGATILITTTTAKPSSRKRSRQVSATRRTRTTTPKSVNEAKEKRRRAFRITAYTGSNTESTTPITLPTSTGRTVQREHRSRVSKEMIITKTVEDNDGDDQDEDSEKNISGNANKKPPSKVSKAIRSKNRQEQQIKNKSDSENPMKKERVEKVTITMEETPDHVYETKEIDKDGIKGKFITITTNNNSVKAVPTKRTRGRTSTIDDAEMEELQRKMEAFQSFDSVIQDTENLRDEPSNLHMAEKYLVGSLLQKLPLPLSRTFSGEKEDNKTENDDNENENEDQSEDYDDVDDNDDEVDENDSEDTDNEDSNDKKSNEEMSRNNNTQTIEKNPSIIKDPNNRNYYYVETS